MLDLILPSIHSAPDICWGDFRLRIDLFYMLHNHERRVEFCLGEGASQLPSKTIAPSMKWISPEKLPQTLSVCRAWGSAPASTMRIRECLDWSCEVVPAANLSPENPGCPCWQDSGRVGDIAKVVSRIEPDQGAAKSRGISVHRHIKSQGRAQELGRILFRDLCMPFVTIATQPC